LTSQKKKKKGNGKDFSCPTPKVLVFKPDTTTDVALVARKKNHHNIKQHHVDEFFQQSERHFHERA